MVTKPHTVEKLLRENAELRRERRMVVRALIEGTRKVRSR